MAHALLRIGRSKAAWETHDLEQVLKTEFRMKDGSWDLRPSVYEIVADDDDLTRQIVRVHAEHTSSFLSPPHKGAPNFDAAQLAPRTSSSLGETAFAFANAAHREIVLQDEAELRTLVSTLLAQQKQRVRIVSLDETLRYIAAVAEDGEWQKAMQTHEKVRKWVELARKKSPPSP